MTRRSGPAVMPDPRSRRQIDRLRIKRATLPLVSLCSRPASHRDDQNHVPTTSSTPMTMTAIFRRAQRVLLSRLRAMMPNEAVIAAPGPGRRLEIHGDAADAGQRLDRVLQRHLRSCRVPVFKQLIFGRRGHLRGRGATRPGQRVQAGQQFAITSRSGRSGPAAQPMPLAIHFEEEHLLVLDQTGRPGGPSAPAIRRARWSTRCSRMRREPCRHRRGAPAGIVIVSTRTRAGPSSSPRPSRPPRPMRDSRGADRAAYGAFVWGVPVPAPARSAAISAAARATARDGGCRRNPGQAGGDRYRVERRFGNHAALIECRLLTGRTHQIACTSRTPAIR